MRSLSREETCRTIGLSEETLDAMLDSGDLLCHVRNGEVRIPLQQLEAFFRDRLVAVFRASVEPPAAAAQTLIVPRPPEVTLAIEEEEIVEPPVIDEPAI